MHHPFHQIGFPGHFFPPNPFLPPGFVMPPTRLPPTSSPATGTLPPSSMPPFFDPILANPQLVQMRAAVAASMMPQFYPQYPGAVPSFLCLPNQDLQLNGDSDDSAQEQHRRVFAAIAAHAQKQAAEKEQELRPKTASPTD